MKSKKSLTLFCCAAMLSSVLCASNAAPPRPIGPICPARRVPLGRQLDGAAPHDATAMERVCYWPSQVARPQQTPMQTPAMESNDTMWLRDGSGLLRFDRDDIVALCDTRGVILGFAAGADLFALCEGDHVVAFWGLRLIDRFGAPWFSVACRIHVGVVRCSADVYLRTYTVQGPLRLAVVVRQQNDGLLPHDRNGSSQPPARVGDEIQGTGTAETGEI